jgi:hypothetical protein
MAIETPKIDTMSIEIKVLRVGNHKMTKAVFRQIPRDSKICGPIWGWVNEHSADCFTPYIAAHRHVVWQLGDALRIGWIDDPGSLENKRIRNPKWLEDWKLTLDSPQLFIAT